MKVLELFAGTCSFSSASQKLGHIVYTSDYDAQFNTDYCVDIMEFNKYKLPFNPDIIWASPPCETFSVASIGYHWNKDNTPKTEQAQIGIDRVLKTLEIIKELNPKYWIIENPRGKLRKMDFMGGLEYTVIQLHTVNMVILV